MNISSEIIIALISSIASVYATFLFNRRKKKNQIQNEFESLTEANRKFRDEIRGDLKAARSRIDKLEIDLETAKETIRKMDLELEAAKLTIIKLEWELAEKNGLIQALTKASLSKNQ